jgi:hypothetical protein
MLERKREDKIDERGERERERERADMVFATIWASSRSKTSCTLFTYVED